MNTRVTLAVAAACAFVILSSSGSSANHSWGGYHWARTSNPFTVKAGDNVDANWDEYLNTAISDWTASDVLNVTKVAGGTRPKNCRATSGRIEVCNARYGSNGWLGLAQIWVSGVHITQAVTKLNDTYFNTATYNTAAWRRLVSCQEIGHDFGLDHQDETFDNPNLGTCMDYTNDPDGTIFGQASNEYPDAHDYQELDTIYKHLDSTTTIGATTLPSSVPAAMRDLEPEGPGQWGRLVRSNANGRLQIYELDFGNGNKIVTEVFWADPTADGRGR